MPWYASLASRIGTATEASVALALVVASTAAQPPPCQAPLPAVVMSWWTGDGTSVDLLHVHDGVLRNGATYAPGVVGAAFSFDGINDYVWIDNAGGTYDWLGQASGPRSEVRAARTGVA